MIHVLWSVSVVEGLEGVSAGGFLEWWRQNPLTIPSDFKPVKGLNSGSDLSLLMV